ncbi:MAG: putative toxin-antitoxin system toxin component, PIN family [Rhodanobacter sp.]
MTRQDPAVPRIVLDTNVCLDLFVFHDVQCQPLLDALQGGAVRAVTRTDCREEWQRVLHYPQLPVDDRTRPAIAAAFDALIWRIFDEGCVAEVDPRLPRCADPDDQKFLELALACDARWLLSKDKELLRLGERTRRAGWFSILLPQQWRPPLR